MPCEYIPEFCNCNYPIMFGGRCQGCGGKVRTKKKEKEGSEGKKESLRCGLCDVEVDGSFDDHVKSEQHQSKLPKREPVKLPKHPVREISEAEKKQNRDNIEIAQAENLGYHPLHGRSYYEVRCECGEISDVYCWSGSKRCSNCGKLLHLYLSFRKDP